MVRLRTKATEFSFSLVLVLKERDQMDMRTRVWDDNIRKGIKEIELQALYEDD